MAKRQSNQRRQQTISKGRKSVSGRQTASGQSSRRAPASASASGAQSVPSNTRHSTAGAKGVARGTPRMKGMGLRGKFMIIMSLLTASGMAVVGILMAITTDHFLVNQSKHHGIELAKMSGQVGRAILDMHARSQVEGAGPMQAHEMEQSVKRLLEGGRTWGGDQRWTFIDLIQFDGGNLGGFAGQGVGNKAQGTGAAERAETSMSIPGRGAVRLSQYKDIEVYRITKKINNTPTPAYRFRIKLPTPDSTPELPQYSETEVIVDVAIDTLNKVKMNLFAIIIVAVILVVGIVMIVANTLAAKITKPVRLLMKDMQVVSEGDLSHQTRAHSSDEIGILANEFNRMTQNLKVAQVALVEQEKAAYELSIAQEVQQQLLPAEIPEIPGYEIGSYYQGAQAVSGDYYDYIPLGNGLWGFIVADVSGKGIPGSMVMAVTRTIIRLVAQKHNHNAAETLKETNRLIAKQIKRGMFVTAFYSVLDTASGTLTFSSAGHNPMVIYRGEARKMELASPKGIAIGFNEGPLFDKNVQQFQVQLGPKDLFVIYTDGFPEAMNEEDEEFGDDEFYKRIGVHGGKGAKGVIDGLLADLTEHRGNAAQSDDLTILAVCRV